MSKYFYTCFEPDVYWFDETCKLRGAIAPHLAQEGWNFLQANVRSIFFEIYFTVTLAI